MMTTAGNEEDREVTVQKHRRRKMKVQKHRRKVRFLKHNYHYTMQRYIIDNVYLNKAGHTAT